MLASPISFQKQLVSNKSVYLKFIFIKIQRKIKLLQKKEIDSIAKKKVVTATLCFLHRKTPVFGELALYHGSILTQLT